MSCCSSRVFAYHNALYENIYPKAHKDAREALSSFAVFPVAPAIAALPNAGVQSCLRSEDKQHQGKILLYLFFRLNTGRIPA